MAATCEISNVFSNYFNAMYSSEDPTLAPAPPTTFGTEDLVLTLNNQQMSLEGPAPVGCVGPQTRSQRDRTDPLAVLHLAEKASWTGERPQFWSKTQVLEWISYQVEKNKYDASSIDFSRCDMDGATLCSCALEELRLVFGPLGDQLHAQLRDLTSSSSDELSWIIELLEKDGMAFQEGLGDPGPFDQGSPFAQELLDDGRQTSPYYGSTYGPGAPSPVVLMPPLQGPLLPRVPTPLTRVEVMWTWTSPIARSSLEMAFLTIRRGNPSTGRGNGGVPES